MQGEGVPLLDPLPTNEAHQRAASIIQRTYRTSVSRRNSVAFSDAEEVLDPGDNNDDEDEGDNQVAGEYDGEGGDVEMGSSEEQEEEKIEEQEPSRAQLWWSMAGVSAIAGAGYMYKMSQTQSDLPVDEDDAIALMALAKVKGEATTLAATPQ